MLKLVQKTAILALISVAPALAMAFDSRETVTLPQLSTAQQALLAAGKPAVSTKRAKINRGELYAVINAEPGKVWQHIYNYNDVKTWYPDMLESKLISRNGNDAELAGKIDMPLVFEDRHFKLEGNYTATPTMVEGKAAYVGQFNYVKGSGNMKDMYGYWLVMENPNKKGTTLLKYVVNVDLGVWIPDFVLRWAQSRMFPGIVKGLEKKIK